MSLKSSIDKRCQHCGKVQVTTFWDDGSPRAYFPCHCKYDPETGPPNYPRELRRGSAALSSAPVRSYAWKHLVSGEIGGMSAASKGDLFEWSGFGAIRVHDEVKGYVAVEVVMKDGKLVEGSAGPILSR
jgi:hypothetical protein